MEDPRIRDYVTTETREAYAGEEGLRVLQYLKAEFDETALPILASSENSTVYQLDLDDRRYALKEINLFSKSKLAEYFRLGERYSAIAMFECAQAYHINRLPTPRPVAALEAWSGRHLRRSRIVTEYKERKRPFMHSSGFEDYQQGKILLDHLHRLGGIHGDPNRDNFIVTDEMMYLLDFIPCRKRPLLHILWSEVDQLIFMRKHGKALNSQGPDVARSFSWKSPSFWARRYLALEKALPRKVARWLPYRVPRWANDTKIRKEKG